MFDAVLSRMAERPEGIGGGDPGKPGLFKINGKEVPAASQVHKMEMAPSDVIEAQTPGGGGYGAPTL